MTSTTDTTPVDTTTASNETNAPTSSSNSTTQSTEGPGTNASESKLAPEQMAESVVDTGIGYVPGDANWNHLSRGAQSGFWVWDYTTNMYWNGDVDYWLLKKDGFSYDPKTKTATYEFKPEYSYWWNGDHVTAEDYRIQREIKRLQDPKGSDWKSWSLKDNYTLQGTRKKQINPDLLHTGRDRVMEYRETYRPWLEKLQDDTTDKARKSTTNSLTKMKITTKQFANKGLGNSVYKPKDWSTRKIVWEKFDKHPLADDVPFPTVQFRVANGSSSNQMITHDKLDYASGEFPSEIRGSSPDYLQTIYKKKAIQSRNLLFNYKNKHVGRRNVRRALMTILDFTKLVDLWKGKGGFVKQHQTGLPEPLEEKWLGKDLLDELYEYPVKSDPKQAKNFMKKAGYTKQDGTWVDSDGDPLEFTFLNPSSGGVLPLYKAMVQHWSQWGAKPNNKVVTGTQWGSSVFSPNGDWDVTVFLHGFDNLDAVNFFNTTNPYHMRLGSSTDKIEQWLKDGKTDSPLNGRPLTLTIPSNPGLEVGSDGGEQINIYKLVEKLKSTQDDDAARTIIRQLSRYFNYDLPMFDMFPQVAAIWGDTKNFNWPNNQDMWGQKGTRAAAATWCKGVVKPVSKNQ